MNQSKYYKQQTNWYSKPKIFELLLELKEQDIPYDEAIRNIHTYRSP